MERSTPAGFWNSVQLHCGVQMMWWKDEKKGKELLMNVSPAWRLCKTTLANWSSAPLSVRMAHQMACRAQKEKRLSIRVKQLQVRRAGVSENHWDISVMRSCFHKKNIYTFPKKFRTFFLNHLWEKHLWMLKLKDFSIFCRWTVIFKCFQQRKYKKH